MGDDVKPYYETKLGKLYCGDCLEIMPELEPDSVDMVLCDPPYGTTSCKWDSIIPLEPMWIQLKRLIKDKRAIVMTASQPFTTILIHSNMKDFKYCWVWNKTFGKEPFAINRRPMKAHEDVTVFYKNQPIFNPQKTWGRPYIDKRKGQKIKSEHYIKDRIGINNKGYREPISVIDFKHSNHGQAHPTQKPQQLMLYLIETYTNKGDIVLDFTIGSGTTAVACEELKRRWIGIEQEEKYCEIAAKRIEKENQQLRLF